MNRRAFRGVAAGRYTTLAILLVLAGLSWRWLLGMPSGVGMSMSPTMGLSIAPFLILWTVMMVAMMAPTAAPMILTYQAITSRRTERNSTPTTWVFVGGYLLLWALTGVGAYALAVGAEHAARHFAVSPRWAARLGGAVIVVAGIYQFTPWKAFCLAQCGNPIQFIMTSWRGGVTGALRMGLRHGLYCLGCCWLLFAILFPLGMMNIAAMAAITLLILAEKTLPPRRWSVGVAGAILVIYGSAVIAAPSLLPTFSAGTSMAMPSAPVPNRAPVEPSALAPDAERQAFRIPTSAKTPP